MYASQKKLDLSNEQHRKKAHFHLERAVHADAVLCALTDEHAGRPVYQVRTFRGGAGLSDLARLGGRIGDTIYEATDLERSFPMPEGRKTDIESVAPTPSNEDKIEEVRVRQPNKAWELVALEFGIYLGSGGDPETGHAFVRDLAEGQGLIHASKSSRWKHVNTWLTYYNKRSST